MNKAYELAEAEIGTVEWAKGDNPKVVAYFRDSGNAGVKSDATAWCAAFVGAMLHRAGMQGTGSLAARSYLKWGDGVNRDQAKPGDIVIFKRGNSQWEGHVAFFVRDNGSTITVLGGNQADAVNRRAYRADALLGIRRMNTSPVADSPRPEPAIKPPVPQARPVEAVKPAPASPAPARQGGLWAWLVRALAAWRQRGKA